MNQTKKRLSIIKLAISITDIETIQLQVLKLTSIKTDTKIQNILTLLQAGSYAQSQALITKYIDSTSDTILQRTSQKEYPIISENDQAIIDEFQLFVTPTPENSKETININNYAPVEAKITKNAQSIDFDSLLNMEADDVLPNNIDINLFHTTETSIALDTFFNTTHEEEISEILDENHIPIDTFFEDKNIVETVLEKSTEVKVSKKDKIITEQQILEEKDIFNTPITEETNTSIRYMPIPHISQKFTSIEKHYPLIQKTYEKFETVEILLRKIKKDGYTEEEIEDMLIYIRKCIEKSKSAEAAQLLLVCGATESKYAQFMLARELYIGSVLIKNIPESFTLMNTLAIDDYPEALCDLGQFYENGIGTTQDYMKAEGLYKEAVNLGIKRAKKHYIRLKELNREFI